MKPDPLGYKYIYVNNISSDSLNNFKTEIRSANLNEKISADLTSDPNTNYRIIENVLTKAKQNNLSRKKVKFNKFKHAKSEWITAGIIKSIKRRDTLYRDLKNTPTNSLDYEQRKINLRTLNVILKRRIFIAKKTYYHSLFTKYAFNIKKTWSAIKNILGTKKTISPDKMLIDNNITSKTQTIVNHFNQYFVNIGHTLASKLNDVEPDSHKKYLKSPTSKLFSFQLVNEDATSKIFDNIPHKNSTGVDDISTFLIKSVKFDLIKAVTTTVNQSLTTGIFPDNLKLAKVIPLFKKGDPTSINNYRPISLLPALSKIFERVIYNQINNYFTLNNLYYEGQYGFRSKHSTELAALDIIDTITSRMEKGNIPITIYLDLSKAFDTLNHTILLDKLKFYGIQGSSLNLIENYLKNRKQCVEINNIRSAFTNILTGVPQGSILGPLLFIIYMNDIPFASTTFKTIIYADDTTLLANLSDFYFKNNTKVNIKMLNNELDKIRLWLRANKLTLNTQKSKFMLFYQPKKRLEIPKIEINNEKIECVEQFDFLGLILHKHLIWKSHVTKVANKISKTIGIVNKLKYQLPQTTLLTIYNSLILPHLNYCLLAWGHDSKRIHKLQKKAIRIIDKSHFFSHTDPIFKKLNVLKIYDLHYVQQLKFYFKYTNNCLPVYFQNFTFQTGLETHNYNTRGALICETP